ncbi:MAG: hypothetical protein AAFX78_03615 [Cyanobacteria bacterium J06638_20]
MTDLKLGFVISAKGGQQTVAEITKVEAKVDEIRKRNEAAAKSAAALQKAYGLTDDEVALVTQELLKAADAAEKLKNEAAETNERLEKSALTAAGAIGGALTTAVGGVFAKGALDAAEYERILGGVNKRLEDTGGSAGVSLDQIVAYADGLGDATLTSEEATLRASRALLSFRSIQGDTFFRTLAISQDLAEVLEGGLEANLIQVAKALEDPVKGLTALSRSGTQFTAQQQEQIKALVASGDQLAAQELILAELEKQYGGTAVAAAQGLTGALDTLGENANDTFRIFGEQVLPISTQVVNVFSGLLDTFIQAPPIIQKLVVGTTALAGVLGAAVVAISAYNLAKRTQIIQESLATAQTLKSLTATAAKTAVTTTAATVQTAYAVATGRATAAQLAQTKALAGGALAGAAFAGAIAAVALVVDTYAKTTEAARATEAATREVEQSLIDVGKAGDDVGASVASNLSEAEQNAQALADGLGPVQNALDVVRGALPGVATAAEVATNRSKVAFGELTEAAGQVEDEAAQLALALKDGVTIDPQTVGATVTSINTAIDALKAQNPVTEEAIALRDAQIRRLEGYSAAISEATGVSDQLTDATGALASQVANLSDELKAAQAELENTALAQEASIQEALASGQISQQQADQQLAGNEQALLEERIAAAREKIAELQEVKAGTDDPAEIESVNAEILAIENSLNQDRIKLAQSSVNEKKKAEAEAEKAAKDAEKAATEAAKEEAEKRKEIAQDEADALKESRDEAKRESEDAFDDNETDIERQNQDELGKLKAAQETALNKLREDGQKRIEDFKEKSETALQDYKERRETAFQKKQQTDAQAFQKQLEAERDRESGRIDAAANEAEFQTSLRLADSPEERQRLIDEREQVKERAEILAEEERKALATTQEPEALTPIEEARTALEERIAAQQQGFQDAQQQEKEVFEQELEADIFAIKAENERQLGVVQKEVNNEIAAAEKLAAQQIIDLERDWEDEKLERERVFKNDQRRLDKENAEEIKRILESAETPATAGSLRSGGPVDPGKLYQVHKDEIFVPNQAGTILSQRASRAVVRESLSGRQVAQIERQIAPTQIVGVGIPSLDNRGVEARLDKVVRGLKRIERQGRLTPGAPQSFDPTPDPGRAALRKHMAATGSRVRRSRL